MTHRYRGLVIGAALACILGVQVLSYMNVRSLRISVDRLMERIDDMSTVTTTYDGADGQTHSVTTTRKDGEDPAAWIQRHKAEVEAMKAVFPPATSPK